MEAQDVGVVADYVDWSLKLDLNSPSAPWQGVIQLQSDWVDVCTDAVKSKATRSFWISYRPADPIEKALQRTIEVKLDASKPGHVVCTDVPVPFHVNIDLPHKTLYARYGDRAETQLQDISAHKDVHSNKRRLQCIAISSSGDLGASGSVEGSLRVWQTDDLVLRRELVGHVDDVNSVKWFPSNQVLLSASADLTLRIWDVANAACGAVLKGHAAGVSDCAIVDRGRNVISSSRDGTSKLWDVSEQQVITTFGERRFDNPIHQCSLSQLPNAPSYANTPHEKEIGTEGKLLVVAHEKRHVTGYDIRGRIVVFNADTPSVPNTCLLVDNWLCYGLENGMVGAWDLRNMREPACVLQPYVSPITSLAVSNTSGSSIWAAWREGSVFEWTPNPTSTMDTSTTEQLTTYKERVLAGSEYEPVYQIAATTQAVFAAARDGLRKYVLS